jgi:hypothetical protein
VGAQYSPSLSVAYGYLTATDIENHVQYCIGKGKTETSITGPAVSVAKGTAVLLTGSVLDMSPASPNTPAISDTDMSEWMDYMHGQNATLINNPPEPNGVPIKLEYKQADGSWKDIDEVISDSHGNFGFEWTPPDEGTFEVRAMLQGSESYWSSSDTTYVAVGPEPSQGQPETEEPSAEAPFPTTEVAIIAAVSVVAVVAIAAYWALKRRK